jgi:hypothetical protein
VSGYLVAQISSIELVDTNKLEDKRAEVVAEYLGSIPNEILSQYLVALRSKYKIEINNSIVEKVLE